MVKQGTIKLNNTLKRAYRLFEDLSGIEASAARKKEIRDFLLDNIPDDIIDRIMREFHREYEKSMRD